MFVYEEAWDYNGYLESDLLEYKEKQEKIFSKIELSDNNIKKIKKIHNTVNLVVFAEVYCPDCRALVPYIEKIRSLNNKINVSIFPRKGNENYLTAHSKEGKIPTVLMEDLKKGDEIFVPILEEFPEKIKSEILSLTNEEEKSNFIYEYRTGHRNNEIENYLVEKILKILG